MNIEESKAFLTSKGIIISDKSYGYTVTVHARGHGTEGPYQVTMDEMDSILSLGKIRLLLYEEGAKQIRIEVYKT